MTIAVTAPDNTVHNFPDNTPQDVIKDTLSKYVRYSGELGTAAAAGRGLIASTLGSISVPTPIDQNYGLAKSQGGVPYSGTETFENILPKPELGQIHPTAQTVGEILPAIGAATDLGASTAVKVLPSAGRNLVRTISALGPGRAERVASTVSKIGPVSTDVGPLGQRILSDVRGRILNMSKERYAKVNSDVDSDIAERIRRLGALKKNPAIVKEVTEAEKPQALARAMARHSADLNSLIEQTRLGKSMAGNLVKFSPEGKALQPGQETARLAESAVPKAAFQDKQSVREFIELLGGDVKTAEKYADEYAATSLSERTRNIDPGQAYSAARNWIEKNRSWLELFPNLQRQSDAYAARLKYADSVWRKAVGAGILAARGAAFGGLAGASYYGLKNLLGD